MARFTALGADAGRIEVMGALKAVARPLPCDEAVLAGLQAVIGDRPVWLASSTFDTEHAAIVGAHAQVVEAVSDSLMIWAPRHTRDGDVAEALARVVFDHVARRSRGEPLEPDTQVYLADTIGEMDLWYRVSRAAFIGGSLVPKGGHTPYEPAAYGCAVITGPHVENFQTPYRRLLAAGQATEVFDAASLAAAFLSPPPPPQKHGQDHDTILAPIVADLQHLLADNRRHADA